LPVSFQNMIPFIECQFVLSEDEDYADELVDFINSYQPDLIFVGSKGHTNASVLLLGSVAEKLAMKLGKTPLFIVKQKGENLGFFEALLKI
jgi:nucleotide-binding universal stress UspA family protein